MKSIDREDIDEQIELSKVIDIESIPFIKLMDVFIGFVYDELITKDNLQKLSIDDRTEIMIRNYALKGKEFYEKSISKEALMKERVSAWGAYRGLADKSVSNTLLRIVICCLYDEKDAEYDVYGSGEMLGVFFSLLFDLGSGYCNRFSRYIQKYLVQ
jgi:hypothetical protein